MSNAITYKKTIQFYSVTVLSKKAASAAIFDFQGASILKD